MTTVNKGLDCVMQGTASFKQSDITFCGVEYLAGLIFDISKSIPYPFRWQDASVFKNSRVELLVIRSLQIFCFRASNLGVTETFNYPSI